MQYCVKAFPAVRDCQHDLVSLETILPTSTPHTTASGSMYHGSKWCYTASVHSQRQWAATCTARRVNEGSGFICLCYCAGSPPFVMSGRAIPNGQRLCVVQLVEPMSELELRSPHILDCLAR
uniref:Uncharacterized protein n=1 Tax=Haptolina brevifila TaxID=156173 RepID=A0A7S2CLC9_9EUKA